MKHLGKIIIAALLCSVTGIIFTSSCKDKGTEGVDILRPIAENVTGKWDLDKSYVKEEGNWVADTFPEGMRQTITLSPDGEAVIAVTDAEHQTLLHAGKWSADEDTDKLTINKSSFDLLLLHSDKFEMGFDMAISAEGDTIYGEFKWQLLRMDESQKTLAEKLVGKWYFEKSFEKKDGEWIEISFGLPDEGWHEYKNDGTYTGYSRSGTNEMTAKADWSINNSTGELRLTYKGETALYTIYFEDNDNTLYILYSQNIDPATGEMVTGEFRDMLIRE